MKVTEIFNAEVKVVNEQQDYVIEARVRIDNGQVTNIYQGQVKIEDETLAYFENWASLNFNVMDSSKVMEIIPEILAFINEVKNDDELINGVLGVDND